MVSLERAQPPLARFPACHGGKIVARECLRCRSSLAITSDAVTAHAGVLAGKSGVVLAVSTSAVAIGVGHDGAFTRVDGCGRWLGYAGRGAWIGLAGLCSVLPAGETVRGCGLPSWGHE